MQETESEFVRHEPCPNCTSSDAFSIYSDGHGWCFACEYRQAGIEDVTTHSTQRKGNVHYDGEFSRITSRRITEETCRKFNVRCDTGANGPVIRFPYYSKAGKLVAYKERDKSKTFKWNGRNEDKRLFGQQLFGGGRTLVISEGELDCLAIWQARPKWPVMSVPNGAAGAYKALAAVLPELLKFEEVVLLFDGDDAGKEAAEACAGLFPHDQLFVANLGQYKDPCEALQANDAEAIRQAIYNKTKYSPKTIVDGRNLFDLVSQPLQGKDAEWPWKGLNDVTGGLRLRELVTLTAGTGSGKSTASGEVLQHLVDQNQKVGGIFLEEGIKRSALRLMTVKANKPLHLNNEIPEDELRTAFNLSVGSGNVYLRDGFGSVSPDSILADIRYMVKAYDVRWIILDHLSILLSGNESDNERILIDRTMTKLRSFVEETGIGMIVISHLRRHQGDKGAEDGNAISLGHLRGSHSISQLSDFVIAIQRDISSGETTADLVVLKNRFNGNCGKAATLSYNAATGRLTEIPNTTVKTPNTPNSYEDF